ATGQRVDLQLHFHPGLQRRKFALGYVEGGLQLGGVDDAEDRRVDLDEVARLDVALGDHAGDGRDDVGVGHLEVGQAVGGAGVLQVVAQLVDVVGADQF